nr:hypothetical protein [Microctonus hyperodae filamentous virus]
MPKADMFVQCVVKIEGVRDYMTSKYKNTAPAHDAPSLQRKNKQYCVEYKDIAKDRFAVMPVPKNMEFERCADLDDETPTSYVYIGSEKFALVRNDELMALNQRDWNRRQIQRGNAFLANMDRKLFVLGKKQQETLDVVKRVALEKDEIIKRKDAIIEQKDAQLKDKDAEKNKLIAEMQKKDEIMQRKEEEMEKKDKLISTLVTRLMSEKE